VLFRSELLIVMDNSCREPVVFNDEVPVSTKREGMGVGTSSMQEIAERYHGTVQFAWKEGIFYTSVLMQYESHTRYNS